MTTEPTETEFDRWAKSFEALEATSWHSGRSAICMYAVREGPHKRACGQEAAHRSDGVPVCDSHRGRGARKSWRGYVEGA